MTDTQESAKRKRNTKVGRVVSAAMQKSVTVAVDRLVKHELYGKTLRRTAKFMAHDESQQCGVGDRVRIEECRPMSKRKRWIVREILEKARA